MQTTDWLWFPSPALHFRHVSPGIPLFQVNTQVPSLLLCHLPKEKYLLPHPSKYSSNFTNGRRISCHPISVCNCNIYKLKELLQFCHKKIEIPSAVQITFSSQRPDSYFEFDPWKGSIFQLIPSNSYLLFPASPRIWILLLYLIFQKDC